MGGKMSRNKGKSGEREAAKVLSVLFNTDVSRGVQFSGSPDSPDVVGLSELGLHPEIKRDETTLSNRVQKELNLYGIAVVGVHEETSTSFILLPVNNTSCWPEPAQLNKLDKIKITKRLFLAHEQADNDAGQALLPFVMTRRNRGNWWIVLRLYNYREFYKKLDSRLTTV